MADAFVADAEPPGRVALVLHLVEVDAVVGQRLDRRQVPNDQSNQQSNMTMTVPSLSFSRDPLFRVFFSQLDRLG